MGIGKGSISSNKNDSKGMLSRGNFVIDEKQSCETQTTASSKFVLKDCLRVGGRLELTQVGFSQKYPLFLRSNHKFTYLFVEDAHARLLHAGPQALQCSLQDKASSDGADYGALAKGTGHNCSTSLYNGRR